MLKTLLGLLSFLLPAIIPGQSIAPLYREGDVFKNAQGDTVRLWGVNVVAFYPDHQTAVAFADKLASLGINLVRWHHMLRYSDDWNSQIFSLVTYQNNSRTPDSLAWDRFDFLNAELERRGIYIMLAGHWTREYLPGDVNILSTNAQDSLAWMNAISELNAMYWADAIDLRKMLITFDERCALLDEEFISYLLEHENPYLNHIKYKDNPQVLTFEVINEFSSEYTIYMGNRYDLSNYPALAYWDNKLQNKFADYCHQAGIAPFNLYEPATDTEYRISSDFLIQLDRDHFNRIKNHIFSHYPTNNMSITYSTLWRGERSAEMHFNEAGHIEDHIYEEPFVGFSADDFIYKLTSRSAQQDKPYIIGEINMSEWDTDSLKSRRASMYLAAAVYGSLHNWAGITWFAWNHGEFEVGTDGWAINESQEPAGAGNLIGNLITDATVIDHLRTTGLIFKKQLVSASRNPITVWVDSTYLPWYSYPPPPTVPYVAGWQNISAVRKMYGPVPSDQAVAPYMTGPPAHPFVSDTGEIVKDTVRKQLSFSAPQAEGFTGYLDGQPPARRRILEITDTSGFATVVLVATDDRPLEQSEHLIVSRTLMVNDAHTTGPGIILNHLKPETGNYKWHIKFTRPRSAFSGSDYTPLDMDGQNRLILPGNDWTECELAYLNVLSVETHRTDAVRLSQNYPNPFCETTTITFVLPFSAQVKLEVTDMSGRVVDTLIDEYRTRGTHQVRYQTSLPSGVYYYRLITKDNVLSKIMWIK